MSSHRTPRDRSSRVSDASADARVVPMAGKVTATQGAPAHESAAVDEAAIGKGSEATAAPRAGAWFMDDASRAALGLPRRDDDPAGSLGAVDAAASGAVDAAPNGQPDAPEPDVPEPSASEGNPALGGFDGNGMRVISRGRGRPAASVGAATTTTPAIGVTAAAAAPTTATPAAKPGASDAMWRHLVGEDSTAVGTLARVRAPKGVRLRTGAAPGQPDLGILPFDDLVAVERRTGHGWCWVIAMGDLAGHAGFCEEHFLALDPPEPTAHLHRVAPGDSLHEIAARYYGKNFRDGHDARLYVQALVEANKGRKGIYLSDVALSLQERATRGGDEEKTLTTYQGAKVRAGHALWMPSEAFIAHLRGSGAISSGSSDLSQAWRGAKAAVGHVVDGATYGAAFLVGTLEGAWNAIVDLFQGAADMVEAVAKIVYQIIRGNPGAITAMLQGWVQKLQAAWAGRAQIAADFMTKWESEDAWLRGQFQGEVLGWVMMTALLMLATAGASSLAAATGTWASILRALAAVDALGDVMTYVRVAARLPGKAVAVLQRRFGKVAGTAAEVGGDLRDAERAARAAAHAGDDAASDAAGSAAKHEPTPRKEPETAPAKPELSASDWVDQLKSRLTPEELAHYEQSKSRWRTPEEMQSSFHGDLDAARQEIARTAGAKAEGQSVREAAARVSAQRAEQIREFVAQRGLMNDPRVVRMLEGLPENPSAKDLLKAVKDLRSLVIAELRAEEIAARFPDAKVLREVKIWEEQPEISVQSFEAMAVDKKLDFTRRIDADGQGRIYKIMTDIDLLLIEKAPDGGKAKILRLEQHKTGLGDTPGKAKAQNDVALRKIESARAGDRRIRLEPEAEIDIIDQLDLTSTESAEKVTVGPAGHKKFDESLEITAIDLKQLIEFLVLSGAKKDNIS